MMGGKNFAVFRVTCGQSLTRVCISHRVSGRAGMHVRVGGGLVSLLEAVLSATLRSLMLDGYISRKQK